MARGANERIFSLNNGNASDFCVSSKFNETLVVTYAATLLVLSITIPGSVMVLCYSRVILHIWFTTDEKKATNKALLKSRWKLTKLFMAAKVIFIVSWSASFGRLSSSSFRCSESFQVYEVISILLALLGSMANSILALFVVLALTGGDNSNKRCFGTKPKLFRESGDFSGNRDN